MSSTYAGTWIHKVTGEVVEVVGKTIERAQYGYAAPHFYHLADERKLSGKEFASFVPGIRVGKKWRAACANHEIIATRQKSKNQVVVTIRATSTIDKSSWEYEEQWNGRAIA